MHGQTDQNRGRDEAWYYQLRSTIRPMGGISMAHLNKMEEESLIQVPDLANALVAIRQTQADAYDEEIGPNTP